MSNYNCYCKTSCAGLAIVASIIIGIIAGMLTFMGIITATPAFLWVVFGIAIVYLAISLVSTAFSTNGRYNKCKCLILPVYLSGILGSILTSLILLAIEFAATSVIGAIITGLLLGFFTLIITSSVCLIKCQADCDND